MPRRIAPGRRAPWLIATVAVVGLASLVALADAGDNGLEGARTTVSSLPTATDDLAIALPTTAVPVRPPAIGRVEAGLGVAPVMLDLPAGADARITGAALTVDGELEVRASTLRIALEADRLHRLEAITLDATDPDGGLRPDRTLRFHAELALPSPRPTGRLWLVITAFDSAGHPIGTLRRAVEITGFVPA